MFTIFKTNSRKSVAKKASLLLVALMAPFLLSACAAPEGEPTKIVWWNVFDDPELFEELIQTYEDTANVDIELVNFAFSDYENELVRALASGTGPDIFTIHNSWLPEHRDLIAPLPVIEDFPDATEDERAALEERLAVLPGLRSFVDTYVDVVAKDFVSEGRVYAIPLYVDSLALFYNKDLLASGNFPTPPRTWSEFSQMAASLTQIDPQGRVLRAGAAMGAAGNINRSTDILSALMLQNGAAPVDAERTFAAFDRETKRADDTKYNAGLDALTFYTDFANATSPSFSWSLDRNVWYSIDNFAAGDVAMMLNYSHQVEEVRAANAKLDFGVWPLPQRDDARFDITYANYWGQTVSRSSQVPLEAWEFINFLARDDNNLTYLQGNSRPPAKRSLVPGFENDLDLGVFADQAAVADSFYTPDINLTETVFAAAIDDVNNGRRTAEDALNVAASQITQRLQTRAFPPTGI
jgi:multiple sugar transport system substrate-binding protein